MTNLQPKLWSQFNNLKRTLTPTQTQLNNNKKLKLIENEKTLNNILNTEDICGESDINWSKKLNLILLGIIIQFSASQNNKEGESITNNNTDFWDSVIKKLKNYWLIETYKGLNSEINIQFIKQKFQNLINSIKVDSFESLNNIEEALGNANYLLKLFSLAGNAYINDLKLKINQVEGEVDKFEDLVNTGDLVDSNTLDSADNNSQDGEDKESEDSSESSTTESDNNMEIDDNDSINYNNKSNEIGISMDISMGEGQIIEPSQNSPKEGDKAIDEPGENITNEGGSSPSSGDEEEGVNSESQKEVEEEEFFTPKESSIEEFEQNKIDTPAPKEDDNKETEETESEKEEEPLDTQEEQAQAQGAVNENTQTDKDKLEEADVSIIDVDNIEPGPEIPEPIIIDDQSMNMEGVSEVILDDGDDENVEEGEKVTENKTASGNGDDMSVEESKSDIDGGNEEDDNVEDLMEIDLPENQLNDPNQSDDNSDDLMEFDNPPIEISGSKDNDKVQEVEILSEETDEMDVDEEVAIKLKEQSEGEVDDKEGDESGDKQELEIETEIEPELNPESKVDNEIELEDEAEEASDVEEDQMEVETPTKPSDKIDEDPSEVAEAKGQKIEEDKLIKEEVPIKLDEKNEEDPSYISNELSELTNLTNLEISELTEPTTNQDNTLEKSLSPSNSDKIKKEKDNNNEIDIDLEGIEEEGEEEVKEESDTEGVEIKPEELSSNHASSLATSPSNQSQPQPTPNTGSRDSNRIKQLLLFNWNQLSTHKYANMFQNPIKEANAPDYYRLIKQPMDLNTIKANIRNQKITNIDEFHLNLQIMCYNAIMFNKEDTEIFNRGLELLKSCEEVIHQLRLTNKIEE